ncbi:hypothetical protein [Zoogloea sp.]|uniref:hypothetical protein n=1 Tax=Zoogloea sp. TaxID=49181 RepID=UPI0035AE22F6
MNTDPNLKPVARSPDQSAGADWQFDQHPAVETARLLALALPNAGPCPAEDAFKGMTALNQRLATAPDDEILEGLTRQAALLEALFLSYTRRALESRRPDHAALLQGTALRCQKSLLAVQGAIRQLTEDQRNAQALPAN